MSDLDPALERGDVHEHDQTVGVERSARDEHFELIGIGRTTVVAEEFELFAGPIEHDQQSSVRAPCKTTNVRLDRCANEADQSCFWNHEVIELSNRALGGSHINDRTLAQVHPSWQLALLRIGPLLRRVIPRQHILILQCHR